MNRIEIKSVMDMFGYISTEEVEDKFTEKLETKYILENASVLFSGYYYAIVEGKIPFEVADMIYKKFPDNRYGIRVRCGECNQNPLECLTDDIYEQEHQEITDKYESDFETMMIKNMEAINRKNKRDTKDKYVTRYYVDTKEGLIILLTELNNYYNVKKNIDLEEYSNNIKISSLDMLKQVIFCKSLDEWMNTINHNDATLEKNYQRQLSRFNYQFRELLDEYDYQIIPDNKDFINNDILDDYVVEYIEKTRNNQALIIKSKDNQTKRSCYRNYKGYENTFEYILDNGVVATINH